MNIHITLIVEDTLSEAVVRAVFSQIEKPYRVCNVLKWNKQKIQHTLSDINKASRGFPYLVLTDQDTKKDCPPNQIEKWIHGGVHPNLLYRFATMEVESWVMAHRECFAQFLSVSAKKIPSHPDEIPHPKECLISLARKSRKRRLREDLVPAPGATSKVGPDYNGRLSEFVRNHWRAEIAAQNSPSLARALKRLREFKPVYQNASNPTGR